MSNISHAVSTARRYGNKYSADTNPSHAQREAGNYKKKHIVFQGIPISIESPKGSIRKGLTQDGKPWSAKMLEDYGYIKRTVGHDGDQVDCFVGPNKTSKRVFVVDQLHHHARKFDEHKCLLGFNTEKQAMDAYRGSYGKIYDFHHQIGSVTEMSIDAFKEWLKGGGGKHPISPDVPKYQDGGRVDLAMDMDALHRYGRPNIQWNKDPARQMKPVINPDQSYGIVDSPQAPEEGQIIPQRVRKLADGGDSGPQITDPLNPFADIPVPSADVAQPPPVAQQQPAIPEGYAVNDAGEVFNKQTGEVIQPAQPPQREGGLMQTIPQFAEMVQTPEGREKLQAGAKKFLGLDQGYIAGPVQKLVVDPIKQIASGPREAYEGQLSPEQQADWATNTAMALMGTGAAFAKMRPGTLGVFGGPMSSGADLVALKEAQRLEAMGVHRDKIWEQTGWGRMPYPNAKWFYQIPMRDAKLAEAFPQHPFSEITGEDLVHLPDYRSKSLDQVLQQPELYKAYPFLKDWRVTGIYNDLSNRNTLGGVISDKKYIAVSPQSRESMFNTLVHEVNHVIQEHEGFPLGGNYRQFLPQDFAIHSAGLQMKKSFIDQVLHQQGTNYGSATNAVRRYIAGNATPEDSSLLQRIQSSGIHKDILDYLAKQQAHDAILKEAHDRYLNLAGEAMSRNAELRAKYTPEEIRGITPYSSIQMLPYGPTSWKDVKTSATQYPSLTYPSMSERLATAADAPVVDPHGFYSKADEIVTGGPNKATPQQWIATLKNKGMKPEEDEWVGISKWLNEQKGSVSRADLQNHIRSNRVQFQESIASGETMTGPLPEEWGGNPPNLWDDIHALPEEGMTHPQDFMDWEPPMSPEEYGSFTGYSDMTIPGGSNYKELKMMFKPKGVRTDFYHEHYPGVPNVVASTRFDARPIDGLNTLHIHELQSDWHQQGSKHGYEERPDQLVHKGEGPVPPAPFKKAWPEYMLKKMIRYAVDNGFDQISWPGSIDTIRKTEQWPELSKTKDGRWLIANKKNVTPIIDRYLKDMPRLANKIGNKFGANVKQSMSGDYPVNVLRLTDDLKSHAIEKGFTDFKRGGMARQTTNPMEAAVPLKPGSGQKVVSENIKELHTGKTYARTSAKFGKEKANKQAIAIALSTARKYGKKKAFGGPNIMSLVTRGASRNLQREGMIHSGIPGRTDKIGMNVMAGSYILPADIPSAIGQGNSIAGGHILKGMFSRPMRVRGPKMPNLMPRPPHMPSMSMGHRGSMGGLANGGPAEEDDTDSHVPIVAAGGEYVIHPEVVQDIGHGNINAGHKVLDKFVLQVRKDNIKTLKTLPPPKK